MVNLVKIKLLNFLGWGTTTYAGPYSDVLMEVSVPVWNLEDCVKSFSDSVFNETICAGGKEGGKDSCQVRGINYFLY